MSSSGNAKKEGSLGNSGARFSHTPDRHYLHPNSHKRPRSPADFKREPSPLELGNSVNLQIASSSAIIDKACVMDISTSNVTNVDEYIQLFLTEYCVIDRAAFEDVSEPSVKILVVEEDEDEEKARVGTKRTAPMPVQEIEENAAENLEKQAEAASEPAATDESQVQDAPAVDAAIDDANAVTTSAENSSNVDGDENKTVDDASTVESSDKNNLESSNGDAAPPTQPADASAETKPEQGDAAAAAAAQDGKADTAELSKDDLDKLEQGSDTTVEEIDSDFDDIEKVDESYKVDSSLWQQVDDLSTVDLKPALKEGEAEKVKKADAVVEEEDSGYGDLYYIRSEKEKDLDFQEYIKELCRPQIISYLNDRCAAKGTDVRLTCTVKGNGIQSRWLKDGNPIERSKNLQTRSDGEIYTLEISNITERMAGEYTCEFKNRAGDVTTTSTVKVYDGKLHKPDHLDIALVKDYYDYALGGLVIEANVHGIPRPKVKFFKDGHLLYERVNKVSFFLESGSIFQCLLVRPDKSASGVYTVLAENGSFKKRFDHRVDFETKYSNIHYPLIRHADKKLEDFVETMLSKVPKHPEEAQAQLEAAEQKPAAVEEAPKADETKDLLEAVSTELATVPVDGEGAAVTEEKPKEKKKHHHHHKHHHKKDKKKDEGPKIDADLVDDGEQPEGPSEEIDWYHYKRKFSGVPPHEPYEGETFRIYNSKEKLWWSCGLRNQTVYEGGKMKLFCTVSGPDQNPLIKWLKNGKPLSWSNTIRNFTAEGIACVRFDKIERGDAGTYTCSAKNASGEVITEAKITVIPKLDIPVTSDSKPYFTAILNESYHTVENDLILDAFVRGVPEPTIKWYKDGEEIKKDDRIDICILHDGRFQLRIHAPDESKDQGIYECEASNSSGKAKVKHVVNFKNHLKHTHPKYVFHREDYPVPKVEKVVIEKKPEKPRPVEEVIVVAKDESQAAENAGENEGEGNAETAVADENSPPAGNVDEEKAEKKKPKRGRKRYEGPVEPIPLIRDSTLRLSIAVNLREVILPVGKKIKLCCQFDGPNPNIKWQKNGKPVEQNQRVRVLKSEGMGSLTIEKAQETDSGVYKCVAANSFNQVQTECNVTIFPIEEITVAPTFTRVKDYYNVELDDLILEVQVRGTPAPTLTWKRDGADLDPKTNDQITVMREPNGVYKLCIHHPQKKDGGRFVVEASNSVGKEEIRQSIRFLGRDTFLHTPGIYHADPKTAKEEDPSLANIVIQEEVEEVPDTDEVMMDKWGNVVEKKAKKIPLRKKIFMPKSEEETKEERLIVQKIRNHVEFEAELKNCVAQVGHKAKLLCTAVGPGAKLKWLKNDEEMEFDPPRCKNTTAGLFGSITFLAINENDAGTYKCVASNGICEATSECTLEVIPFQDPNWIKPTYTRNIKEYYDAKTNDLILEVHVRGYPKPRLSWNKDGLDIEDGDDKYFSTRHPDGIHRLNIHNPMIRDSGRYGCSSVNEAGVEDLKHYLKVKSRDQYFHTALLHHADKTQFAKAKEQEKKRMHLLFRRSNLNYDEEKDTYADLDLDEEIPDDVPLQKEPEPVVKPEPEEEEEGEEGKKKEVEEKPKSKYFLEFLTSMENQTGVENTTVKIMCQISGANPQVSWLHNGTPVKYTDDIKNVSNESVAAILFQHAKPEYSGEYTCVVKNRECKIEKSCYLNVLTVPKPKPEGVKPHFPFGMKHSFNSQTDELIIEVVIRGTPRIFMKWYKDATEIKNDDKYLFARDGEIHKLYVSKPTFRDAGIYLLQCENEFGMEFLKYVIEFEEKETPVVSGFIYHADISMLKKKQEEKRKVKMQAMRDADAGIVRTPKVEEPPMPVEKKEVKVAPPAPAPAAEELKPAVEGGEVAEGEHAEFIPGEIEKPLTVFRAHKILNFRKNAEVPLEIIKRLVSQVVCEGKKLKLSCCVSEGDARIKATWYRNGEPLVIDARFSANATEDGIVKLEIKETMIEDTGRYKVVVKTKKGEISSECDVTIYEKEGRYAGEDVAPVVLKAIEDCYRPILKDYVIDVCFRGNPKPTLQWTFSKDGLPINAWKQYTKYQIKHEELNGHYREQLIISNFKFIDNGRYHIHMENRAGVLDIIHVVDYELPLPEEKRKRMDDIFIMNEVPRVLPKPKEPTPPPVVEPPPEEKKEEEVVEEEAVEEEEEEEEVEQQEQQ